MGEWWEWQFWRGERQSSRVQAWGPAITPRWLGAPEGRKSQVADPQGLGFDFRPSWAPLAGAATRTQSCTLGD